MRGEGNRFEMFPNVRNAGGCAVLFRIVSDIVAYFTRGNRMSCTELPGCGMISCRIARTGCGCAGDDDRMRRYP